MENEILSEEARQPFSAVRVDIMSRPHERIRLILISALLMLVIAPAALGQSSGGRFTISSQVVAGGGCGPDGSGGCTPSIGSGNLSVDGTAAEPGASALSRQSPFSLRGGFWYPTLGATPTAANGTVTGRIVDQNGMPVEGAVVRLGGTQNRKFITDGHGFYRFENVETNGFYTVTPSRANYTFNPSVRSFSQIGETTEAAFAATLASGGFVNPLDTPEYIVRQHYLDFLGREPDEAGFNFWSDQILECGNDNACIERRRENVSAAYFLSIEFEQSGYLVYRTHQAAYGDMPNAPVPIKLSEFNPDAYEISQNLIVNQTGWQQRLESNKQAYMSKFVLRPRFVAAYPTTMSPSEFIDKLFVNAGVTPSDSDRRTIAVDEFGSATNTSDAGARARSLRRVAENSVLAQQEFTQAFVLMQYFGYLRRNPFDAPEQTFDYTGYNFWLDKLNSFNGNFQNAEMVKAFLSSIEYRQRFGR